MAALGAAILLLVPSQVQEVPGLQTQLSAAFIPSVIAVALILVGAGLMGYSFLERARLLLRPANLSGGGTLRVGLAVLLLVAYALLFPRLGFVVTSALFVGLYAVMFGSRNPLKIALTLVLVPVVSWLFFELLFRIPLPHGILF